MEKIMQEFKKEIKVNLPYLAFPVSPNCGEKHSFASLWENGKLIYEFFLDIDFKHPQFWTYCDMNRFIGKKMQLLVEDDNITQEEFESLHCANTYPGQENLYHEKGRPELHFSPARGYISDPNGLFYYNGTYHIFFQHDIYNLGWVDWKDHVNMAWGHATSNDLVHWNETPDILLPDNLGPAFSGSGIVDVNNISKLGNGVHPPILLYYTAAGGQGRHTRDLQHVQCLAYSVDGGLTFNKYEHNPLIPFKACGNRDPKVFFNPSLNIWMLIVYTDDGEEYLLYTSNNLIDFKYVTNIKWDNMECPDLLYLPVNGDKENKAMVLWGANGSYMVVEFDGNNIKPLSKSKKLQSDFLHSCAQTFHNSPDGRCIQMAVFRIGSSEASCGCLTVPCELTLHECNGDYWLLSSPCHEIEKMRCSTKTYDCIEIKDKTEFDSSPLMDIEIEMPLQDSSFNINGMRISINKNEKTLSVADSVTTLPYNNVLSLRILVDKTCVQIWEPNNRVSLEFGYNLCNTQIIFEGDFIINKLKIHTLESIWKNYNL